MSLLCSSVVQIFIYFDACSKMVRCARFCVRESVYILK